MKVFVTGASGFIGRNLLCALSVGGHEVTALTHLSEVSAGVRAVRGDVEAPASYEGALEGMDVVLHAAALVDPIDDEARADAVNHRATLALAAAAQTRHVPTFIFLSSIAALGMPWDAGWVPESAPCRPHTPYARSKRAAEVGLLALERPEFRVVVVRPPTVYGSDDTRGNFLGLARAVQTGLFWVPGARQNRVSFCHVDNLTHALERLAASPGARGIIHVADDMTTRFGEVVGLMGRTLGARVPRVPFPLPLAQWAVAGLEQLGRWGRFAPPLSRARLASITCDFAFDLGKLRGLGVTAPLTFEAAAVRTLRAYQKAGLLRR